MDALNPSNPNNINRNIPLYITNGTEDLLVPKTQAETMFNAMQAKYNSTICPATDFACQLKIDLFANCGHGWANSNCNKALVMSNIVSWIDAHWFTSPIPNQVLFLTYPKMGFSW